MLKELHEMTQRIEQISQAEHDLISEVHPTVEKIKEDVAGCVRIGAHELFFDPTFYAQSLDQWLALMEQLRKLV